MRVVLDFLPNPIHAGLYLAEREQIFASHGLTVTINAPTSTSDTLRLMAAGQVDFGYVSLYDFFAARERGVRVKVIAAIVQEPLGALLALPESGIESPKDLVGRRVGISGVPSDRYGVETMVRASGGSPEQITFVTIGYSVLQNLLGGQVTGVYGFWSYEGVQLVQHREARVFRLDAYGAPRYPEIVVFAREDYLKEFPDVASRFLSALQAGYERVIADPEHALDILVETWEGETEDTLRPYLEALLPAFRARNGEVLSLDVEALEAYREWIAGAGMEVEQTEQVEAWATNEFLP